MAIGKWHNLQLIHSRRCSLVACLNRQAAGARHLDHGRVQSTRRHGLCLSRTRRACGGWCQTRPLWKNAMPNVQPARRRPPRENAPTRPRPEASRAPCRLPLRLQPLLLRPRPPRHCPPRPSLLPFPFRYGFLRVCVDQTPYVWVSTHHLLIDPFKVFRGTRHHEIRPLSRATTCLRTP